ncbi:MAG: ABC transporter permease subunit [Roseiflexus sp.]|nr:ABC transporter permease subunit [Roseiflexus sp.]MCS7290636.1 ABC transporter permease subunit [Roseiflexus sp.]MDW8145508.1 ABC transporter permease subunit [Roseiflexaceae bacterium]MDW8231428.1 ABC transporter permease subunit [Roseiflexaceae bacterium]
MLKRFWPWFWFIIGATYFLVPLYATFDFSLRARRGELSFAAYANVLNDIKFVESFWFSFQTALATIVISALVIVPTAYWVQLRMPRLRPVIEFFTLLPFVVPAVVLVFSLARTYNRTPLTDSREGLWVLLVGSYVILSFPYMYRAVDTGLRAINIHDLTEAAQSLGAGWFTILARVIFPNVYTALLSGAFITFAIVMGEFTIAALLAQPAFGPYMNRLASSKVYEPSALAIISFALTWAAIAAMQWIGRGAQARIAGPR